MTPRIQKILLSDGTELDATALAYMLLSSKGNLTLTTPTGKSFNIESEKHLKVKPGQGAQVEWLSDHTGNYNQILFKFLCGLSADGMTELSDERVIRGKFNLAELELNRKEASADEFGDSLALKFKDDNDWAQAKLDARNLDMCMHGHGGIAMQPAGSDHEGFLNKVKWEHSLKVPIEHFAEYASAGSTVVTTYSFPDDNWYVLCQVLADQAVQILMPKADGTTVTYKVLSKSGAKWNDNMVSLGGARFGIKDTPFGDFHIMWDDTNTATSPANEAGAANETVTTLGKYIYIRRVADTSGREATRPALYGTTNEGETKFTISETAGGTQISSAQSGTSRQETVFGNVTKGSKTYPVTDGIVTIDYCDYLVSNTGITPVGTDVVFPIEGGKFTITPIYPFHFASKGGDGIEFGTFNPMHFSAYSGDYRFKADAPIYAVSRGDVEQTSSGKIDYPTQADDTKDIIPAEQIKNAPTWGDMVNAAAMSRHYCITEDMFDLEYDDTAGVAPYNTSYKYTNITIHKDAGVRWKEGALYWFILDTKVATSANRNVRVRIGEDGDWKPVMVTSAVATGSTVFIKAINCVFIYKSVYQPKGALHCFYDTNTTYTINYNIDAGRVKAGGTGAQAISRYSLILMNPDGTWEKLTDTSAAYSTGTTKKVNPKGFILGQIKYYNDTTVLKGGDLMAANYAYNKVASFIGAYSFNCGTAPGWDIGDYIYLVGTVDSDGLFYLDNTKWWSNALPTSNDGKVYIRLGIALTTTDSTMSLLDDRPVFYHDGNNVRLYCFHN